MNNRTIICFIVVLMVSMTSSLVHELTIHDTNVCDVCLHIQSNDDGDLNNGTFSLVPVVESTSNVTIWENSVYQRTIVDGNSIRGPPYFC